MSDSIYYCKKENNTCNIKDTCKRYLEADGNCVATLYKMMCTDKNNHILYIKGELKTQEDTNDNPE